MRCRTPLSRGAIVTGSPFTPLQNLASLAEKTGVPADALQTTVDRHNGFAESGIDEDFGRGKSAAGRSYGDHRIKLNPHLVPIDHGPFYAIAVYPGDLGTKGGLVTDHDAWVLRKDGTAIGGLYACGNTSASVMGRTYPGAGGATSRALTYGMMAAEAALAEAPAA
jgi:3-oxosteroid 1-dehydrogenase